MTRADFLNAILDDGIEEVRHAYAKPDQYRKRDGAIQGFEECRGLDDGQLRTLLASSEADATRRMIDQAEDYWFWRYRALQVAFVANVLSAGAMFVDGVPIVTPTARWLTKALDILAIPHDQQP